MVRRKGALLKLDFFTHSYPHDWRTKKPVIFRATPQWFASIDDFRENILSEIEQVDWIIPWGKHVSIIWFVTVEIGSFRVNAHGVFHCQSSMRKMERQSLRRKQQNMLPSFCGTRFKSLG